jgi:Helix-turn-helix domain
VTTNKNGRPVRQHGTGLETSTMPILHQQAPPVKSRLPRSAQPWDLNREILASDLSQSLKVLLLVIVDHARHGRSKCTASTGTLARESGMTDRHVRNLLPKLESGGWIQIERATGSRQSRHTIFLAPRKGSRPFVKLHEVGNSGACSRKSEVHEVGNRFPTNVFLTAQENVSRCRVEAIQQNFNPPALPDPNGLPPCPAEEIHAALFGAKEQARVAEGAK